MSAIYKVKRKISSFMLANYCIPIFYRSATSPSPFVASNISRHYKCCRARLAPPINKVSVLETSQVHLSRRGKPATSYIVTPFEKHTSDENRRYAITSSDVMHKQRDGAISEVERVQKVYKAFQIAQR